MTYIANNAIHALRSKGYKLVTAESCTGGLIAKTFTDVPGSSDIFDRGFVTYSNDAKIENLGVSSITIEKFGAVSKETATEMVSGALKYSHADIAISVTGIAGPGGGTDDKPVGLVYTGIGIRGHDIHVTKHIFDGSRENIRQQTLEVTLNRIIKALI